jgi:hypothetical protein
VKDSIQQVCSSCGGIHTTVSSVDHYDKISKGMRLIDGDFEDVSYFDLQAVVDGKTVKRCHGWNKAKLGFAGIVQFG